MLPLPLGVAMVQHGCWEALALLGLDSILASRPVARHVTTTTTDSH